MMMIDYNIDKLKKGALRTECVPQVAEKGENSTIIYLWVHTGQPREGS